MKKLLVLAALGLGFVLSAADALAVGYANPFGVPSTAHPFDRWFKRKPLPAFQAAPWYTYWPYNSHFQMSAPLPGQNPSPADYYGGQGGAPGNGLNPYFPSPGK